ncbi:MAG TPA: MFS transporter [Candidatus Acidoferrales bacterium]|nr:MFS transporter [Candidatus Acidoferrales bacterium]
MNSQRPRIFYGWWIVAIAALGLFFGDASITVFSFGVFLKPLSAAFHSGRASISLAFTVKQLTAAGSVLFAGVLVQRYGSRKIILRYTTVFAAILLCNWVFSKELWQLYVFFLAVVFFAVGAGPMPYTNVVSRWFDRRRGLALGLMMFGVGSGAIVVPPAAQYVITKFGWRVAYASFGGAILLVCVPIIVAFLKDTPEEMGLLRDGVGHAATALRNAASNPGLSWREAWHSRAFWLMLCAFSFVGASTNGCVIHMAPMLADRGGSAQIAALASSFAGGALLIGRVGSGYLLDRFFGPYIAVLFFGGAALGMGLLWATGATEIAFLGAFLIGLGLGAEVDLIAYLVSRYFGLRSFGEIYAFFWAAFALSAGLGVYAMGAGFDKTGSYTVPLTGFFFAVLVAIILMLRLGPYRYAPPVSVAAEVQPEVAG